MHLAPAANAVPFSDYFFIYFLSAVFTASPFLQLHFGVNLFFQCSSNDVKDLEIKIYFHVRSSNL